jgi:hypothetical protein
MAHATWKETAKMKPHGRLPAMTVAPVWLGMALGAAAQPAPARPPATAPATQAEAPALRKITEHLWVYAGPINVGILM